MYISRVKMSFCCLLTCLFFNAVASTAGAGNQASAKAKAVEKPRVLVKAESIHVRSFNISKADLSDCLDYLKKKSVEDDTEKEANTKGVGFILSSGSQPLPAVTISVKDTSVWEICQRLAKATGLAVSVSNFKIHFHPKGQRPEPLAGEIFYDPPANDD